MPEFGPVGRDEFDVKERLVRVGVADGRAEVEWDLMDAKNRRVVRVDRGRTLTKELVKAVEKGMKIMEGEVHYSSHSMGMVASFSRPLEYVTPSASSLVS